MQKANRNLAHLLRSGSTARLLNLHGVAEKHREDESWALKPLFQNARLNQALILKHTLRPNERDQMSTERVTATKVIFPLSSDDLRLGGYSLFLEQPNLRQALLEALGEDTDKERLAADEEVLDEIARLPSLDPYLLRERVSKLGRDTARCYFDVSEADIARVQAYVVGEIRRLVEIAYQIEGPEAKLISTKLAKLIMTDESSTKLDPLRTTLRLSREEYVDGMFGWKGFLYYKWQVNSLRDQIKPIAREILTARFIKAHPDDEKQLDATRRDIIRALYASVGEVDNALFRYDKAFEKLVNHSDPSAFRSFLLNAPDMFITAGEHLAAINHICSFWRFRFPPDTPRRMDVDDAYDIFRDFTVSLGGNDMAKAA